MRKFYTDNAIQTYPGFSGFNRQMTMDFRWNSHHKFSTISPGRNWHRNIFIILNHIADTFFNDGTNAFQHFFGSGSKPAKAGTTKMERTGNYSCR